MRAATARFEAEWYETVREVLPEWVDKGPLFDPAMNITQFLLEGMPRHTLSHHAKAWRRRIRKYLKSRLDDIFAAEERPDREQGVQEFLRTANTVHL